MIHKEGYRIILTATLILAALNALVLWGLGGNWFTYAILFLSLVFWILVLQFFRNPKRNTVLNSLHIIAPADGKVVVIEEVDEPEYFKDKRRQISIFMSPLNVHVNRNPISGVVKYVRYYPGKYLVAWHPKSSTENERTTVVIDQGSYAVLFRQIAGAVARRIIWYSREGQEARQGADMGFIRFGSRVDVFVPLEAVVKVQLGDTIRGGETVLASMPE